MSKPTRESSYVAGALRRYAKAQRPRLKNMRRVIPPSEQVRRFLAGEELARVDAGEISPAEFAEYEKAMIEKLRQMQQDGGA